MRLTTFFVSGILVIATGSANANFFDRIKEQANSALEHVESVVGEIEKKLPGKDSASENHESPPQKPVNQEYASREINKKTENTRSSEIDSDFLKESKAVYEKCENNKVQRTRTDCECVAEEFLKERINRGAEVNQDVIFVALRGQCKNMPKYTEFEYNQCMQGPVMLPPHIKITKKEHCDCYIGKWSKLYESYDGEHHVHALRNLKTQALSQCLRSYN